MRYSPVLLALLLILVAVAAWRWPQAGPVEASELEYEVEVAPREGLVDPDDPASPMCSTEVLGLAGNLSLKLDIDPNAGEFALSGESPWIAVEGTAQPEGDGWRLLGEGEGTVADEDFNASVLARITEAFGLEGVYLLESQDNPEDVYCYELTGKGEWPTPPPTPVSTATLTNTPTQTNTPGSGATNTPTSGPTSTPTNTATNTPVTPGAPTDTPTPPITPTDGPPASSTPDTPAQLSVTKELVLIDGTTVREMDGWTVTVLRGGCASEEVVETRTTPFAVALPSGSYGIEEEDRAGWLPWAGQVEGSHCVNVTLNPAGQHSLALQNTPVANGDMSEDGTTNAVDSALVLQWSAQLLGLGPNLDVVGLLRADVNQDGVVDTIDAALILQFGAGFLDELPV